MKKKIKKFLSRIVVLALTTTISFSSAACDVDSSGTGGNGDSGTSGTITNPDKPEPTPTPNPDPTPTPEPTPTPDPDKPTAVTPENLTVNFDNNTTTITVDASWSAQSDSTYTVKVAYNGTEQTYTANEASISLSLEQAPINEYDVSISVKSNGDAGNYLASGYTEAKTINKLTQSEYYALTTSYGIDNRYCSTKGELALQYAYVGDFETVDNESGYISGGKKYTFQGDCFVYYALPDRDEVVKDLTTADDIIMALHEKVGMSAASECAANTATSCYVAKDGRSGDEAYWMVIQSNPEQKKEIATTKIDPADYVDYEGGEYAVAENLNGQPLHISSTGRKDDKLPIDDSKNEIEGIGLSPALYTAVINGYKVKPKAGSRAEEIWNYSRKVLKAITDENMSEQEIAHAIYDWVMYRTNYNSPYLAGNTGENYNQYIDGVLGGTDYNLGVCAAYAKSYAVLCNMMGLDCVYVSGIAGGAHAWNKVKIDGVWYCVDTTHGDTMMPLKNTTYESGSHEYFMLSDKQLSEITYGGREELGNFYDIPGATVDYNYFEHVTFVADDGNTYSLKIDSANEAQINAVAEYFTKQYNAYRQAGGVVIADPADKTKTVTGKIAMFEFSADENGARAVISALYRKIGNHLLGMYGGQAYFEIAE